MICQTKNQEPEPKHKNGHKLEETQTGKKNFEIFSPSEINDYRHFEKFFEKKVLTLFSCHGTITSSKQNTAENTGRKQEEKT